MNQPLLSLPMTSVGWGGALFLYLELTAVGDRLGDGGQFYPVSPLPLKRRNPGFHQGFSLGGLYRTRTCDPYHVKNRIAESQPVVYTGLMAYLMAWKRLMVVQIVATSCQHKPLLPKALPQMHDDPSGISKLISLIRGFKGSSPAAFLVSCIKFWLAPIAVLVDHRCL